MAAAAAGARLARTARRFLRRRKTPAKLVGVAAVAIIATAVGVFELTRTSPSRLTLRPTEFASLGGWPEDHVAAALPAFVASCAMWAGRSDAELLDKTPRSGDFGKTREWRPLCREAATLAPGEAAAREFLEHEFVPALAGNNGAPDGLFTGYYEITLNGSRRREGPYQTPIYRRPPAPSRYSRAEIDAGALDGAGLELLWADNPVDVFFLHIQGSGQVRLRGGGTVRVAYDGQNGRPFVPVGRLLVERGILPRATATMAAIREWMMLHPREGEALRREDPSYVFFREIAGDGPIGAEQVVLSPGRSLAVDRAFIPLGVPVWLDAAERYSATPYRRLVIAQDTGGAIRGPVRGDLFWGTGAAAGVRAGAMRAIGRYYLLLPKAVAARWPAD
jgi:membrane-bound lytic murein transglycosylase A